MRLHRARWLSGAIGLVGVVIFAAVLVMITIHPEEVETQIQRFAIYTVEQGTRDALADRKDDGQVRNGLQQLARQYESQAFELQHYVADHVPMIVASILDGRCKGDCRKAEVIEDVALILVLNKAFELKVKGATLRQFVLERYDRTVANLIADLRVFSFVNALAFAVVLLLTAARGDEIVRHLAPFTGLLVVSVVIASCCYLFGRDWFATLLLNDFVGWAYAIWIGIILAFLIDIGVFRARVTMLILNAVGGVISALPI